MAQRLIDTFDFEDDDQLRLESGNTDIVLSGFGFSSSLIQFLDINLGEGVELSIHTPLTPYVYQLSSFSRTQDLDVVENHQLRGDHSPGFGEAAPAIQQSDMTLIEIDPGAC